MARIAAIVAWIRRRVVHVVWIPSTMMTAPTTVIIIINSIIVAVVVLVAVINNRNGQHGRIMIMIGRGMMVELGLLLTITVSHDHRLQFRFGRRCNRMLILAPAPISAQEMKYE
jgi:hypothetical protein